MTPMQLIAAIAAAQPGPAITKAIEDWHEARGAAWGRYLALRRALRCAPVEPETEATRIRLVKESHALIREWGFATPWSAPGETRQVYDEDLRRLTRETV